MSKLTAKEANKIAREQGYEIQVSMCLSDIRKEAGRGCYKVGVYERLKPKTVEELESLGFKVTNEPSISQQKGGLYHMIYWGDYQGNLL